MIRNISENDYDFVVRHLDSWWGGRKMTDMLPRLFFRYFNSSSFVFLKDGQLVGFLVGFVSDCQPNEGYVHFVGVSPDCRGAGVGSSLYERFFAYCKNRGASVVKCVTSPVNVSSIAFHTKLGFIACSYDSSDCPVPILDYDGPGEDRIVFAKSLLI